jgi:hypothetical protein
MFAHMPTWLPSVDWTPEAITAAATVTLACLTFVLAFGTIFLWLATRKLVSSAEMTAERELRAYVFNGHANVVRFDENTPVAQVVLKNFGQTPAYEVVGWMAVTPSGVPPPATLARPNDATIMHCHLGPGADFHFRTRLTNFPQQLRTQIRQGVSILHVFGEARYIDAFGKNHTLQWRLYLGDDNPIEADGNLAVYPHGGNEAD